MFFSNYRYRLARALLGYNFVHYDAYEIARQDAKSARDELHAALTSKAWSEMPSDEPEFKLDWDYTDACQYLMRDPYSNTYHAARTMLDTLVDDRHKALSRCYDAEKAAGMLPVLKVLVESVSPGKADYGLSSELREKWCKHHYVRANAVHTFLQRMQSGTGYDNIVDMNTSTDGSDFTVTIFDAHLS